LWQFVSGGPLPGSFLGVRGGFVVGLDGFSTVEGSVCQCLLLGLREARPAVVSRLVVLLVHLHVVVGTGVMVLSVLVVLVMVVSAARVLVRGVLAVLAVVDRHLRQSFLALVAEW
jgi:hypothetical protein